MTALLAALAPAVPGAEASLDTAKQTVVVTTDGVRPPVTFPSSPHGLPAPKSWEPAVDEPATYQMQQACVATASRGVVQLRALALSTYGRGGSSPATPRACTSGSASEHKDGRAWDWMLDVHNRADKRAAADFLAWLTGPGPSGVRGEMARRLGIMYVIYNHELWASYRGTWEAYDGSDPHTSHIHISLSWNGARAHTSFWTGHTWLTDYGSCQLFRSQPAVAPTSTPRLTPCATPVSAPRLSRLPLAWMGSVGNVVRKGQRLLGQPITGSFGASLRSAVLRYQGQHDLPKTGALDKPTWASLAPSSRRLNLPAWTAGQAADWGRAHESGTTLRRGSVGRAVYALQIALGVPDASDNGLLARRTAAALVAFKTSHGLSPNAVANVAVWQAL